MKFDVRYFVEPVEFNIVIFLSFFSSFNREKSVNQLIFLDDNLYVGGLMIEFYTIFPCDIFIFGCLVGRLELSSLFNVREVNTDF